MKKGDGDMFMYTYEPLFRTMQKRGITNKGRGQGISGL